MLQSILIAGAQSDIVDAFSLTGLISVAKFCTRILDKISIKKWIFGIIWIYILFFFQGPTGPVGSPGEPGPAGEGIQGQKVVLWKLLSLTFNKFAVVSKLFKATDNSNGVKCCIMDLGFLNHCALWISHWFQIITKLLSSNYQKNCTVPLPVVS